MRRFLRDYSLSIVLILLFLGTWALQTWAGWHEFKAQEAAHGEVARWLGSGGYLWSWLEATMENWQSEYLQLASFVLLSAWLVHKDSPQSKDSQEEDSAKLDRILRRLEALEK